MKFSFYTPFSNKLSEFEDFFQLNPSEFEDRSEGTKHVSQTTVTPSDVFG